MKFGKKTICWVEKTSELHKINKVLNFEYWNKNNYWCVFFYKEYVPSLRAVHMYQPSSANSVERISRLLLVSVNTRGDVVIGSKFEDSLLPKKIHNGWKQQNMLSLYSNTIYVLKYVDYRVMLSFMTLFLLTQNLKI